MNELSDLRFFTPLKHIFATWCYTLASSYLYVSALVSSLACSSVILKIIVNTNFMLHD